MMKSDTDQLTCVENKPAIKGMSNKPSVAAATCFNDSWVEQLKINVLMIVSRITSY